jgi:uncharacterized repeat protein (TIGR02543 family)
VAIDIVLTDEQIKDLDVTKLSAYYFNEELKKWEFVGGSYKSSTKTFHFVTKHFSKYTIAELRSEFTVSFDACGGSSVESILVADNSLPAVPEVPTRKGYTFLGWYQDSDYKTVWDFTLNKINSDITLYANWIKNPAKAGSLKVVQKSSTGVTITWRKVTGATGYEVYRSNTAKGSYKRIADIVGNNTTDKKLNSKKQYYYKVRAYKLVDQKKIYGDFSGIKSAKLSNKSGIS